jgi:transposase
MSMANNEHGSAVIAATESELMTGHKSARKQQIEVITRGERRRSWSVEQKREIVAESLEPGMSPITVARRHGIGSGQLYTWRRQLREGRFGGECQLPARFARVAVLTGPQQRESAVTSARHEAGSTSVRGAVTRSGGSIEIALPGGVSVWVDSQVDSGALRRVLAALAIR